MGKIGDLWVKLGLKKQDFDKGMEDAKSKTSSFSDKMKNLATVAKVAWAAVAAAVVKFVNDAIKMTQKWGDKWNETMAGIKGAYSSFVRTISSGEGWPNLFDNMREAARLAREAAKALDEVFERKTSYSYQEAMTEREIANLQLIMRDSRKSNAERQAAAEKIIELEKQLGETKKDIYSQEAAAQRDLFRSQTQMNDEEIDFLVKNYNQNRAIIQQSRDYLAKRAQLQNELQAAQNSYGTGAMSDSAYKSIEARINAAKQGLADLEASTSSAVKNVAEMTKKYDTSSDELVANMAAAEVAVINIDTEVAHASARATAMLGSLSQTGGKIVAPTIDTTATEGVKTLSQQLEEAGGNVDLLKRKLIDGAELAAAGWTDAGNAIRAIYTQIAKTTDAGGNEVKLLVTPVLENGQILSPEQLAQYIDMNLQGASDMLNADDLGIVIKAGVEVDEKSQKNLENLVRTFYSGEIAVRSWTDAIREEAEFNQQLAESIDEVNESVQEFLDNQMSEFLDGIIAETEKATEEMERLAEDFRRAIVEGFSAGVQELTDQLFGLKEFNAGAILQALLTPLADMAIREGELLIAQGLGIEAIKDSLLALDGIPAIVAGGALLAIGAAAKSGLAALANGGSSATTSSYYGDGASYGVAQVETEITVYVEGRISGSDIVLSGQNTMNSWNR